MDEKMMYTTVFEVADEAFWFNLVQSHAARTGEVSLVGRHAYHVRGGKGRVGC